MLAWIGESGTFGSATAVQNAVIDALAHLGVRHIDMPIPGPLPSKRCYGLDPAIAAITSKVS